MTKLSSNLFQAGLENEEVDGGCTGDEYCGDFNRSFGGGMVMACSLERGRAGGGGCAVGGTTAEGLTLEKADDVATAGLPLLHSVLEPFVLEDELLVNVEVGTCAVDVAGFVGKFCPLTPEEFCRVTVNLWREGSGVR